MRLIASVFGIACAAALGGCRVGRLGASVVKTQEETAKGVLYTDSLFTDDGYSKLVR